jgi:hypothetical protein
MNDQAVSGDAPAARGNARAGAARQHLDAGVQELPPMIFA